MKLKKLLPSAGFTSIAAIATPLVTSCANKGTEVVWNKGQDAPTTDVQDTQFASWEDATQAYFDAIDNDYMILSIDSVLDAIAYGEKLYLNTHKVTSRTDSVNKDKHTISTHTTITGKSLINESVEYTYTFEAKNVEYIIAPNYTFETKNVGYIIAPNLMTINDPITSHVFFQPLLVYEVDVAHRLYDPADPASEEFTKAVEVIMDHAHELYQDTNWYFYSSIETNGEFSSQRVDHTNVCEYAYEAIYDYSLALFDDFTILSQYFKEVSIVPEGEN